jgi:hypothetical protein
MIIKGGFLTMGTKRVGLARMEALMENLDRALDLEGSDVTVNSLISDLGVTVTAGNCTISDGNLKVDGGSAFLRGYDATAKIPSVVTQWPAHTDSSASDHTVTIAQLLTGILEVDPAADITFTLPTAALAVAGVTGVAVGDCIDFSVINTGTATADEIITLAMGTNGTAVGFMGVKCPGVAVGDSEGSGLFRLRFTAIAGAGSYTVYRLA